MKSGARHLRGIAWAGLAVLCWGPLFPIAKRALAAMDAFVLGSLRYLIGGAVFCLLLAAFEGRRAFSYDGRLLAATVYGVIGITGFNVLVWLGLSYTRPEHTAIVLALQAPLAALALWGLGRQRPDGFTLGCIGIAFCGVVLVVTRGDPASVMAGMDARQALFGDLLVLLGGAGWVVYGLGAASFAGWSVLRFSTLTSIPGTFGLLAANAAAMAAGASSLPGTEVLGGMLWQIAFFSLVSVVLGVFSFNAAVARIGPLNTALLLNLVPVTVFAIEAALGRVFTTAELVGAGVVVAALIANNLHLRWRSPASGKA